MSDYLFSLCLLLCQASDSFKMIMLPSFVNKRDSSLPTNNVTQSQTHSSFLLLLFLKVYLFFILINYRKRDTCQIVVEPR